MSSFFTLPASQKKRKRTEATNGAPIKKRNTATSTRPKQNGARAKADREESISGSESEDEDERRPRAVDYEEEEGDEDDATETAADVRRRLAEQYLENVKAEVGFDPAGFDAADLDKDLIAERLKEDVAESKGKLYRRIAEELGFGHAERSWAQRDRNDKNDRWDSRGINAVAVQGEWAYTADVDFRHALCKWQLPTPPRLLDDKQPNGEIRESNTTPRRKPKRVLVAKTDRSKAADPSYAGHIAPILCIAASEDGRFVVTGGVDKRLIIWDAATLKPLKVFTQHRDSVTGLAFRRGTNQLYSCSADRTIRNWSLDELAYIETLFGHQDSVISVSALSGDRCVSVGSRDRTARYWKVNEQEQLVFRGADPTSSSSKKKKSKKSGTEEEGDVYVEGSIDVIAMIDDNNFITGSDNGSLSLWSIHKKKPVFTYALAHGLDPQLTPEEAFSEEHPDPNTKLPPPQPRWITALATVPYSDVVLSGSWDGQIRAWKVSEDMRRIEALGPVGISATDSDGSLINGVVNSLALTERGDRGKDGLCIVVGVGKQMRLGNWRKFKGKNGFCVLEVPRKVHETLADGSQRSDSSGTLVGST